MFLIEGHTEAVGSDVDNLSLSDRRAESVALVLSQQFGVPPENLTTQGDGSHYLKIPTPGPERANRRVTVRRIPPQGASQTSADRRTRITHFNQLSAALTRLSPSLTGTLRSGS